MIAILRRFRSDTSGAVTVDWVVLTAAVVGLAVTGAVSIAQGTTAMGGNLATYLSNNDIFAQND